jgi:hypothetical protein
MFVNLDRFDERRKLTPWHAMQWLASTFYPNLVNNCQLNLAHSCRIRLALERRGGSCRDGKLRRRLKKIQKDRPIVDRVTLFSEKWPTFSSNEYVVHRVSLFTEIASIFIQWIVDRVLLCHKNDQHFVSMTSTGWLFFAETTYISSNEWPTGCLNFNQNYKHFHPMKSSTGCRIFLQKRFSNLSLTGCRFSEQGTRVTRLGKFSPLGWRITLGSFAKITQISQIIWLLFSGTTSKAQNPTWQMQTCQTSQCRI